MNPYSGEIMFDIHPVTISPVLPTIVRICFYLSPTSQLPRDNHVALTSNDKSIIAHPEYKLTSTWDECKTDDEERQ